MEFDNPFVDSVTHLQGKSKSFTCLSCITLGFHMTGLHRANLQRKLERTTALIKLDQNSIFFKVEIKGTLPECLTISLCK